MVYIIDDGTSEGLLEWLGNKALNALTLGASGKIEEIRRTARMVDARYQATVGHFEQKVKRVRELAEERGSANRAAMIMLEETIDVLRRHHATEVRLPDQSAVDESALNDSLPTFQRLQNIVVEFNLAVELATSSGIGAATGISAWAAVSAFGAASTGTAISSLSGIAASKAALAWFGGGALAAGGGGMALGAVVLGSLFLVPVVCASAWFGHNAADKKIAELRPKIEEVRLATQRFEEATSQLNLEAEALERATRRTMLWTANCSARLREVRGAISGLEKAGLELADSVRSGCVPTDTGSA